MSNTEIDHELLAWLKAEQAEWDRNAAYEQALEETHFHSNYLHSSSTGDLLEGGHNFAMFDPGDGVYTPPSPSQAPLPDAEKQSLTQLQRGSELPGYKEIVTEDEEMSDEEKEDREDQRQNRLFREVVDEKKLNRGDQLEPLTREEELRLVDKFGSVEHAILEDSYLWNGMLPVMSDETEKDPAIIKACQNIRRFRVMEKPDGDDQLAAQRYKQAEGKFWNSIKLLQAQRPTIQTFINQYKREMKKEEDVKRKAKLKTAIAEMWEIRQRAIISLDRDNIGASWAWQNRWGFGEREGLVDDMAAVADEERFEEGDQPEEDFSDLLEDKPWQEASAKYRAKLLAEQLWNVDGDRWVGRDKKKFVKQLDKLSGPEETNYYARVAENNHITYLRGREKVWSTPKAKLANLRKAIIAGYRNSVKRCAPKEFLGNGAIREMQLRNMQLQEKRSSKAAVPASRSVKQFQTPTFTIGQKWHKHWLPKKQKDQLLELIDEQYVERQTAAPLPPPQDREVAVLRRPAQLELVR